MDKIDRLFDAIEHPDLYSEEDIEAMLADPEVRGIYELLDQTRMTLNSIPTPDVEAEWETFKKNHPATQQHKPVNILNLFTRNIAASIAIGITSLAAVAAVVGASVNYVLEKKADTPSTSIETAVVEKENTVPDNTLYVAEEASAKAPETIVFNNEPLETIANRIADYYGCKAEFSTDAPKSLRFYFRWDQTHTLGEVIESLNNFEQIHIYVKDKTIKID